MNAYVNGTTSSTSELKEVKLNSDGRVQLKFSDKYDNASVELYIEHSEIKQLLYALAIFADKK